MTHSCSGVNTNAPSIKTWLGTQLVKLARSTVKTEHNTDDVQLTPLTTITEITE